MFEPIKLAVYRYLGIQVPEYDRDAPESLDEQVSRWARYGGYVMSALSATVMVAVPAVWVGLPVTGWVHLVAGAVVCAGLSHAAGVGVRRVLSRTGPVTASQARLVGLLVAMPVWNIGLEVASRSVYAAGVRWPVSHHAWLAAAACSTSVLCYQVARGRLDARVGLLFTPPRRAPRLAPERWGLVEVQPDRLDRIVTAVHVVIRRLAPTYLVTAAFVGAGFLVGTVL